MCDRAQTAAGGAEAYAFTPYRCTHSMSAPGDMPSAFALDDAATRDRDGDEPCLFVSVRCRPDMLRRKLVAVLAALG